MNLDEVNQGNTRNRKRRRIGRGSGSGQGKTAGKGHNGHKSRSGYSRHPIFQGGDLPMVRRIPKRGFHNRFASTVVAINVGQICDEFESGDAVTPQLLKDRGIVKLRFDELKVLGDGEVTMPLKITAHSFSQSAKEKIESAGGTVIRVAAKKTPKQRVADLATKSPAAKK